MIRIDFKVEDDHVLTTWIKEDVDCHSMMGRLIFSKQEFQLFKFHNVGRTSEIRFEEKR